MNILNSIHGQKKKKKIQKLMILKIFLLLLIREYISKILFISNKSQR